MTKNNCLHFCMSQHSSFKFKFHLIIQYINIVYYRFILDHLSYLRFLFQQNFMNEFSYQIVFSLKLYFVANQTPKVHLQADLLGPKHQTSYFLNSCETDLKSFAEMKFKQIRCFRCYPSFSITVHICFQINTLLNVLPDEVPTTKFRVSPEDSTELFRAESSSVSRLLAVPELEDVADVLDVAVVVVEKQLSFDIFFIKKVFYF